MPDDTCGIIITRPVNAAERLASRLREHGLKNARIVISPLLKIVLARAKFGPETFRGIIFTSANGVSGVDHLDIPRGIEVFCVGSRTADCARKAGFANVFRAQDSVSLLDLVADGSKPGRLLYARGRHVSVDLKGRLEDLGIEVREEVVYDQQPIALRTEALTMLDSIPCIVPLFSARTAQILGRQAASLPDPGHATCCISEQVANAFPLAWSRRVARTPELVSVVEEVVRMYREFHHSGGVSQVSGRKR